MRPTTKERETMLLETVVAHVPAQPELDADQAEYGQLSAKTRAAFGDAAIEVGCPDRGAQDLEESASDTIANILHHLDYYAGTEGVDIDRILRTARENFEAER